MNINKTIESALKNYQTGNLQKAEHLCKNILGKNPHNITAIHLLGLIFYQMGNYDSAIKYLQRSIQLNKNNGNVYTDLGNALCKKGHLDEAISCYQKALQLNPDNANVYNNLGFAYKNKGQLDEAISYYQKALQLNPKDADIYNSLGTALKDRGQLDKAITFFQKAIQINPYCVDAHNNLGAVYQIKGLLNDATSYLLKTITLNPHYTSAYNNLGIVFIDKGDIHKAEMYFQKILQIQPNHSVAYSNLLLGMSYDKLFSPESIHAEHVRYADQFEKPLLGQRSVHLNKPIPDRRLRIGYISSDFRRHSVAYFIEPVLSAHNHKDFDIFCYADVVAPDEMTRRLHGQADCWRTIVKKSHEDVAALIRKDSIDILIDLSGHTAKNRMLVFARKPAPVQVTWIGYPATTGLSAMDYKIVDSYTDPPGITEQYYSEELIRMPNCFLCYLPDFESPDVGPLPALSSEHIRFGSFNNFSKISTEVIDLWGRILLGLPEAQLVLKTRCLIDPTIRADVLEMFTRMGITSDRIDLLSWTPSTKEHLGIYNQIDIALDTFPYNGTTTTCESLWMGVPVISLTGNTHASRVGGSLLANTGLKELTATTSEEYICIASDLARDIGRLQYLRKSLRTRIANSPLTDANRFTKDLELCYRNIWIRWCTSSPV